MISRYSYAMKVEKYRVIFRISQHRCTNQYTVQFHAHLYTYRYNCVDIAEAGERSTNELSDGID